MRAAAKKITTSTTGRADPKNRIRESHENFCRSRQSRRTQRREVHQQNCSAYDKLAPDVPDNWNRYYDQSTGRFISEDPSLQPRTNVYLDGERLPPGQRTKAAFFATDPRQIQSYAYPDDAIDNTDPSGEGVWGCLKCYYYYVKAAKAAQRCRDSQPPPSCDENGNNGDANGIGLGGVGAANLRRCAQQEPDIDKMMQSCAACPSPPPGALGYTPSK